MVNLLPLKDRGNVMLRFAEGDRIEVHVAPAGGTNAGWKAGTVTEVFYRHDGFPEGTCAAYKLRLDDGQTVYVPQDIESLLRSAGRRWMRYVRATCWVQGGRVGMNLTVHSLQLNQVVEHDIGDVSDRFHQHHINRLESASPLAALPEETLHLVLRALPFTIRLQLSACSHWVEQAVAHRTLWRTLDFTSAPPSVANALTDTYLEQLLERINARSCLEVLCLRGCHRIVGSGLMPLRGSRALKEIDLRRSWAQLHDGSETDRAHVDPARIPLRGIHIEHLVVGMIRAVAANQSQLMYLKVHQADVDPSGCGLGSSQPLALIKRLQDGLRHAWRERCGRNGTVCEHCAVQPMAQVTWGRWPGKPCAMCGLYSCESSRKPKNGGTCPKLRACAYCDVVICSQCRVARPPRPARTALQFYRLDHLERAIEAAVADEATVVDGTTVEEVEEAIAHDFATLDVEDAARYVAKAEADQERAAIEMDEWRIKTQSVGALGESMHAASRINLCPGGCGELCCLQCRRDRWSKCASCELRRCDSCLLMCPVCNERLCSDCAGEELAAYGVCGPCLATARSRSDRGEQEVDDVDEADHEGEREDEHEEGHASPTPPLSDEEG
uniref:F-box domain-containing protein n=1 Tax=Haptolina brevifila TaxID=156173 RepID=A0A7S2HD47_9EUKA|mmetsp:Transcript_53466/g.106361  ORF Transcript_53466/g.106361 Transcript_53466/m.106361 type:complete len:612 (+) Transcript_53466:101-1936(+)